MRVNQTITFSEDTVSQSVRVEILSNATKGNMFSLILCKIDDNNTLTLFPPNITITIATAGGFIYN